MRTISYELVLISVSPLRAEDDGTDGAAHNRNDEGHTE